MTPALAANGAASDAAVAPTSAPTRAQRISSPCLQGEGREGVVPRHTRDETNRLHTHPVTNLKAEQMDLTRR